MTLDTSRALPGGAENTRTAAGLSMYHISPQRGAILAPEPKISFRRGASLVSCELGKSQGLKGKRHDWKRGAIERFSKSSRRRVLRLVSSLVRSMVPVFITLTYPDLFPEDERIWKKHLDNFFKRLLREFPSAVVIWRMEAKERKSGENRGKLAPHFHLLAYNVPFLALLSWIPRAWFEVVKSGDPRHYNAGTRVEQVRSVRGVLYYTAKYICKAENIPLPGWGRFWGIAGRRKTLCGPDGKLTVHDKLREIQGELEVMDLDANTARMILRYMRKIGSRLYHKGRYVGKRKVPGGGVKYTLICDAEQWRDRLPRLVELANA